MMEVRLREAALKNAALLKENAMLRTQVAKLEQEVSAFCLLGAINVCYVN